MHHYQPANTGRRPGRGYSVHTNFRLAHIVLSTAPTHSLENRNKCIEYFVFRCFVNVTYGGLRFLTSYSFTRIGTVDLKIAETHIVRYSPFCKKCVTSSRGGQSAKFTTIHIDCNFLMSITVSTLSSSHLFLVSNKQENIKKN